MSVKRFVCLAISRKGGGHCIAGREIGGDGTVQNGWIRPISEREMHEVSSTECRYGDKSNPELGDIIRLAMKNHAPKECHVEDWVLDNGFWWVKEGALILGQIQALAETPAALWTNGHDTLAGINDEIPHALSSNLGSSLTFIRVDDMQIKVFAPGSNYGSAKRRAQGQFKYNGVDYWLTITDESIEAEYLAKDNGTYPFGACHLTISLGEPFVKSKDQQKYVYKLIAGVFRDV